MWHNHIQETSWSQEKKELVIVQGEKIIGDHTSGQTDNLIRDNLTSNSSNKRTTFLPLKSLEILETYFSCRGTIAWIIIAEKKTEETALVNVTIIEWKCRQVIQHNSFFYCSKEKLAFNQNPDGNFSGVEKLLFLKSNSRYWIDH